MQRFRITVSRVELSHFDEFYEIDATSEKEALENFTIDISNPNYVDPIDYENRGFYEDFTEDVVEAFLSGDRKFFILEKIERIKTKDEIDFESLSKQREDLEKELIKVNNKLNRYKN